MEASPPLSAMQRSSSRGFPCCLRVSISFSSAGLGYPSDSRTMNRSIWESGRSWVPEAPTGFWVAMTTKGSGTGWVIPSTVTVRSSMASRRALWVRLVARLSSSARNRLQRMAPSLYSMAPVALLYTEKPTMSEGSTSGVNWTRLYLRDRTLEKARAMVVLPTPGMSSNRMWPPARMARSAMTSTPSLPTTAFFTSSRMPLGSFIYASSIILQVVLYSNMSQNCDMEVNSALILKKVYKCDTIGPL